MSSLSPSFKNFKLTDFLFKVILWRNNLPQFFQDITNLPPRQFQIDFFLDIQKMESRNIVIVAGRGIGKTLALAIVALWYVFILSITEQKAMKVVILGGSLKQAQICFNYIMEFINKIPLLQQSLAKEPTQQEILFKDGSWIRPLPASEKSVRGFHPDILIIDEAAEVEDKIIFAALPMTVPSPYARQIFSSTPSTGFSWIESRWEHQQELSYPEWKFFNWNAESFLPADQINLLKNMMPADAYAVEIQGLPYKREGKVFRLEDLRECQEENIIQELTGETYAGIDWGYYPAPTVIVITQKIGDIWKVLRTERFLAENFEHVHNTLEQICRDFRVITVYTDSTDKGENLRLAGRGLPVQPIAFKGEKSIMISNLRGIIEQHKFRFDPHDRELTNQLLDYVYDSKRNDDYVDALMLSVRAQPAVSSPFDLREILKASVSYRSSSLPQDSKRKKGINKRLRELGRM